MKKNVQKESFWIWFSQNKLRAIVLGFVIVFPFLVSVGIKISNYFYNATEINLAAKGLSNSDWFSFWGSLSGGVTTLIAVLWTLYQTNKNHSDLLNEQEKQRKLDVLPVLSLQPIRTATSGFLASAFGNLSKEEEPKGLYIDEIEPEYREYDISEVFCVFNTQGILFRDFLKEDEKVKIKNMGKRNIVNLETGVTATVCTDTVFLRPFWVNSVGKQAALNIRLEIKKEDDLIRYGHVFSLSPKDKIKLGFLVDLPNIEVPKKVGQYKLIMRYSDIYSNEYRQEHDFSLVTDRKNGTGFIININVAQKDDV